MLKPVDGPPGEQPVGDLVHQLVEDGKAYARAEIGVAKAIATDKVSAARMPAILFAAALLVMQAAVTVLAVAVCLWLLPMVGPLLAGFIAFLIFAAGAGLLGWLGIKKIKEAA
jgi:hypothetical protein